MIDFKKIKIGGWIPDLPDFRDLMGLPEVLISQIRDVKKPAAANLLKYVPRIRNQMSLGSCVMQGCPAGAELLDNKIDGKYVGLSSLMGYYELRKRLGEEYIEQDSGGYIRDGIKVLNKIGLCEETLWPYIPEKFTESPPEKCYNNAKQQRLIEYRRLNSLTQIRDSVFVGCPVVAGFTLYDSFYNVDSTGIVSMPKDSESVIGGHCMLIVGYDDLNCRFTVVNSWGQEWGNNGICYIPYDYLWLMDDMWMMIKLNYNI
jgi:C1A family cysteine protease